MSGVEQSAGQDHKPHRIDIEEVTADLYLDSEAEDELLSVLYAWRDEAVKDAAINWSDSEQWPQELCDLLERRFEAGRCEGIRDEQQHRIDQAKDQADLERTCGTCGHDVTMKPADWCTSPDFHHTSPPGEVSS